MGTFDDIDERIRKEEEAIRAHKDFVKEQIQRMQNVCKEFAKEALERGLPTRDFATDSISRSRFGRVLHRLTNPPKQGWYLVLGEEENNYGGADTWGVAILDNGSVRSAGHGEIYYFPYPNNSCTFYIDYGGKTLTFKLDTIPEISNLFHYLRGGGTVAEFENKLKDLLVSYATNRKI